MDVLSYLRTNILAYWWQLLLFVISANLCGIIPSFFSNTGPRGWYGSLNKPGFTPPNGAFLPVWTFLYISMGLAAFLVWRDGGGFTGKAGLSLRVYILSLILNLTWTPAFFNGQSPPAGIIILVMLIGSVIAYAYLFWKFNRFSSFLQIPYLIWLSIATALNIAIHDMNPSTL